jgi:hypothetical protein
MSTDGCVTGRFTAAAQKWRRPEPERITATSVALDEGGVPFAVVALEAECRVTPGDPEGGPGAQQYMLPRVAGPDEKGARFLAERGLEPVAAYEAPPGEETTHGFPRKVLLAEDKDGNGGLFLETPMGWAPVHIARYVHVPAKSGHPVAATIAEVFVVPFTVVFDFATFPIQWFLAPWLPLTPP